jgi:hypothetical protein
MVVTKSNAAIEEYIARNTEKLEKQADAISRVAASSFDISNWLVYLVLPLTLQLLMPGYPKAAALLSSLMFMSLALLRKLLTSPIQAFQWLWNFKSMGYLGFQLSPKPKYLVPILIAILLLVIGARILAPKLNTHFIPNLGLRRKKKELNGFSTLMKMTESQPV